MFTNKTYYDNQNKYNKTYYETLSFLKSRSLAIF